MEKNFQHQVQATIQELKAKFVPDELLFAGVVYYLCEGQNKKLLRREVMRELTGGEVLKDSKCTVMHIRKKCMEKFQQHELFT